MLLQITIKSPTKICTLCCYMKCKEIAPIVLNLKEGSSTKSMVHGVDPCLPSAATRRRVVETFANAPSAIFHCSAPSTRVYGPPRCEFGILQSRQRLGLWSGSSAVTARGSFIKFVLHKSKVVKCTCISVCNGGGGMHAATKCILATRASCNFYGGLNRDLSIL
jgi:hypothetical protein